MTRTRPRINMRPSVGLDPRLAAIVIQLLVERVRVKGESTSLRGKIDG
jgi:hypothetical protein